MPPRRTRKTQTNEELQQQLPSKTRATARKTRFTEKTKPITKQILYNRFLKREKPYPKQKQIPIKQLASIVSNKTFEDESFQCCLCYTVFVCPQVTQCGHTFCKKCISESLLYRTTCPICKLDLKDTKITDNFFLEKFITQKLDQNEKYKQEYLLTKQTYQKWFDEKALPFEGLKVEDPIDFRDKEYYWVAARVVKIESPKKIWVKYMKDGNSNVETLPIYSERIAKSNSILSLKQVRKIESRNLGSMFFTARRALYSGHYSLNRAMQIQSNLRRGNVEGMGNFIGNLLRIQSFPEMRQVFLSEQVEGQRRQEGQEESDSDILPSIFGNNRDNFNFFE